MSGTNGKRARQAAAARWSDYQPPSLPNAAALEKALQDAKRMTPAQVAQSSVDVGIHKPDGKLTKPYGG